MHYSDLAMNCQETHPCSVASAPGQGLCKVGDRGLDVPVVCPLATETKINTGTSGGYRAPDGNITARMPGPARHRGQERADGCEPKRNFAKTLAADPAPATSRPRYDKCEYMAWHS